MHRKNIVAIYKDKGVSPNSYRCLKKLLCEHYEVLIVSAAQINSGEFLNKIKAIVFPGGADVPYCELLGEIGTKNIRHFVEQGGCYIGICAGSYFAADKIHFTCSNGIQISGERKLKFFNGVINGPAFGEYIDGSHESAKLVAVKINEKIYNAYFNGGGFFQANEDAVFETIASYVKPQTPAAIKIKVKKGNALLFSIHPEYDNEFLNKVINNKESGFENLIGLTLDDYIQQWFLDEVNLAVNL